MAVYKVERLKRLKKSFKIYRTTFTGRSRFLRGFLESTRFININKPNVEQSRFIDTNPTKPHRFVNSLAFNGFVFIGHYSIKVTYAYIAIRGFDLLLLCT